MAADSSCNGRYFPDSAANFKRLLEECKGRKIAVAGHMRPDGDCISSQLAMAYLFRKWGAAEVVCVNKDEIPHLYKEFAGSEKFLLSEEFNGEGYDIVAVDCADYERISPTFSARFPAPFACVDHHVSNAPYARINILESKSAATAELIAGMMYDAKIEIPQALANTLYMGVMTDTRQLTTSNTALRTFQISTRLVASGASPAEVSILLYQREKFSRMKLLAQFLQSLTMHYDGKVCIGLLPLGIYERTGAKKEDSDGFVDYARNVDGVEIAVLLESMPDGVKGSLRSKRPEMQVNEIAAQFGGGGHLSASGFSVKMNLDEFFPKLLAIIGDQLNR